MTSLSNPTSHSNWVLPGKLAIGGYPDPEAGMVEQLLTQGFDAIACLQTSAELEKFRPYRNLLPTSCLWLQLPIRDRLTASDENLLSFVQLLQFLLQQGRKIYVHCHDGHGRCGTLAAVLLRQEEKLSYDAVITRINSQHRTRPYKPEVQIPQCKGQQAQVKRLCS